MTERASLEPGLVRPAIGLQAAPHEVEHALADEGPDGFGGVRRAAELDHHPVAGLGEVGDGIEQRAVEVEQHGAGRRGESVRGHGGLSYRRVAEAGGYGRSGGRRQPCPTPPQGAQQAGHQQRHRHHDK